MPHDRFTAIYGGLPTVEKKLYDAVPIQQAQGVAAICRESARLLGGTPLDQTVALARMNQLIGKGLVKEPQSGKFVRVAVKTKSEKTAAASSGFEPPRLPPKTQPEPGSTIKSRPAPLDTLAALAQQAEEMKAAMVRFVAGLESAAIEIQEAFEASEKQSEKLRQLQALLKGLGE